MIHADRFANAERLHSSEGDVTVAAFAVCVRKILHLPAGEPAASAVFFVHAWLIANAQIPVFRTAVDSVGTQFAMKTFICYYRSSTYGISMREVM